MQVSLLDKIDLKKKFVMRDKRTFHKDKKG